MCVQRLFSLLLPKGCCVASPWQSCIQHPCVAFPHKWKAINFGIMICEIILTNSKRVFLWRKNSVFHWICQLAISDTPFASGNLVLTLEHKKMRFLNLIWIYIQIKINSRKTIWEFIFSISLGHRAVCKSKLYRTMSSAQIAFHSKISMKINENVK